MYFYYNKSIETAPDGIKKRDKRVMKIINPDDLEDLGLHNFYKSEGYDELDEDIRDTYFNEMHEINSTFVTSSVIEIVGAKSYRMV